MFFFQKKYSDFGGGKNKYSDSEFLSYNLMLNSGKDRASYLDPHQKVVPKPGKDRRFTRKEMISIV